MKKVDNTVVLTLEEVQMLLAFVDAEFKEDAKSYLDMYKFGPEHDEAKYEAYDFVKSNDPDFYKMIDDLKELISQQYIVPHSFLSRKHFLPEYENCCSFCSKNNNEVFINISDFKVVKWLGPIITHFNSEGNESHVQKIFNFHKCIRVAIIKYTDRYFKQL